MKDFKVYLQKKRLSPDSIRIYTAQLQHFLHWLQGQNLAAEQVKHADVLAYLQYCRQKQYRENHIKSHLRSIRMYYDYRQQRPNPTEGIRLPKQQKTVPRGLLDQQQLLAFYRSFNAQAKASIIILGLLIFQALRKKEVTALQRSQFYLEQKKVYIPASNRINGRTLDLAEEQLAELQSYLAELETDQLFSPKQVEAGFQQVGYYLKKQYGKITGIHQLRASRYTIWLQDHNLRQVQYLAGHRYVSSTERYRATHLKDLQIQLQKHHPLHREN